MPVNNNKSKPAVAIDSLGCKLNQAEMESLARQLTGAGYTLVSPTEKADIYILNSCTVTHIADRKTRQKLRGYHRLNPAARLIVTGCYAERLPEELEALEGVTMVVSNTAKSDILRLIEDIEVPDRISSGFSETALRTRSSIKIQDGCRSNCAYCIVPLVRSRLDNVSPDRIVEDIKARVNEGFQEVVLTGTEVGLYRHAGVGLLELLVRILAETEITRIRLSSLQPPEISPDLVALWQDNRLCPHFHISLQSGSDSVLSRMNRRYTTGEYRRVVDLIREKVPGAAVTTDVIVGFPGETDAEFRQTLDFSRQMKFARIHVFPYSSRPGTAAAAMTPVVSAAVKKERSRQMLSLAGEAMKAFHASNIGKTTEVLFEQQARGFWTGLTGNYIRVYIKSRVDMTNRLVPVKLTTGFRDGLWGEFI
jgi:threonylcarbamoyladenosine tRNA methylthiotransferase MtaB